MLTRRLLPLAAVLVLLFGAPSTAIADPGAECPIGQDDCSVFDNEKGEGGNNGGNNSGNNGGGDRKCTWYDKDVPCYDSVFGWFNQEKGCYYKKAEPQLSAPEGKTDAEGDWYTPTCLNETGEPIGTGVPAWFEEAPGGGPNPLDLALEALAGITLRGPDIQIRPDANGAGLVGLPVWLWVNKSDETWGDNSNFAVDGDLRVDITARVTRLTFDLGDGTTIDCSSDGGTPYPPGATGPSPDCGHVYTKSSRKQPGGKYTIEATTTWTVEWTTTGGGLGGTITPAPVRTETASVRINELQVVTE